MSGKSWADQNERGSSLLLRVMIWLTLNLGWNLAQILLVPITAWFFATSPAARAASRQFLDRSLGRPATASDVFRHLHTFSRAILDRVLLLSNRVEDFRIELIGLDHLNMTLAHGGGCVLLGSHLGSFEVLRAIGRDAPVRVRPLMFRHNAGGPTRILERIDPSLRDSVIDIGATGSMLEVRECLARGEIVGILGDRAPGERNLVETRFLGSQAAFPAGPLILAAMLGAPIVLFYGIRTGPRRYDGAFRALRSTPRARAGPSEWRACAPAWNSTRVGWRRCVSRIRSTGSTSIHSGKPNRMTTRKARAVLLAPLVAFLLAAAPPATPNEQLLKTLMSRLAQVPEQRASFEEQKTLAALNQPLHSSGYLFYRRPGHLEKITRAPRPESVIVDGERLTLTSANGTSHVIDLDNQPELRALIDTLRASLAGDLATLRQFYRVSADGSMAAWRLTLVPTDRGLARFLRETTIDGSGTALHAIRVVEANGNEQLMTIDAAP